MRLLDLGRGFLAEILPREQDLVAEQLVQLVDVDAAHLARLVRYLKLVSAAFVLGFVLQGGASLLPLANALVLHHFVRLCLYAELRGLLTKFID